MVEDVTYGASEAFKLYDLSFQTGLNAVNRLTADNFLTGYGYVWAVNRG